MRVLVSFILLIFGANAVLAQLSEKRARFHHRYVDSSGVYIDSLPTPDDSVFVKGKDYDLTGVNDKGDEKGLKIFDNLTLNLSLAVGDEEDRQMGTFKRGTFWVINNVTKIATLTFWNPELGSNHYFFNGEVFRNDLKIIKSLYTDKGYYDAEIVKYTAQLSEDKSSIKIKIFIREGPPTVLLEDPVVKIVSLTPVVDFKRELESKNLVSQTYVQKGVPLDRSIIDASKAVIQRIFSQNGYISAEVSEKIDTAGFGEHKAKLTYMVIPGRYAVFGKTTVAGNYYKDNLAKGEVVDTTKKIVEDYVILRKVRYRQGRSFNPDRLNLSIGQVNGLGVFRSVKPIIIQKRYDLDSTILRPKAALDSVRHQAENRLNDKNVNLWAYGVPVDTLDIAMTVSDRKEKNLKPGIGITNEQADLPEGDRSSFRFLNLQATWQAKNFMGGARKLQISGQLSKGFTTNRFFANYMLAKISYRQPSFKIPLWDDADNDLLTTVSGERNNTFAYDFVKYEVTPTFFRQITGSISFNITPLALTKITTLRKPMLLPGQQPIENVLTTNSRTGLTFNTSDDFFYPSKGLLVYLTGDFAGFVLPSDLKYMKLNLDNRKYFGFTKRFTMAVRARAGTVVLYSKGKSIPPSELFYGGGPNSVRSWGIKELSIVTEDTSGSPLNFSGGNSIIEGGVEFRYTIFTARDPSEAILGMDLALFYDVGQVWENYNFKNISHKDGEKLPNSVAHAVGAGTRIRTLIGPIRVDIGFKLQDPKNLKVLDRDGNVVNISKTRSSQISRIALQITLGQPF